jgi:hypothetical protein
MSVECVIMILSHIAVTLVPSLLLSQEIPVSNLDQETLCLTEAVCGLSQSLRADVGIPPPASFHILSNLFIIL